MTESQLKQRILEVANLEISCSCLKTFVSEYNNNIVHLPISQLVKSFDDDIQPLVDYIIERTDLPLTKDAKPKLVLRKLCD